MDFRKERKIGFLEKISLWWKFEGQYYGQDIKIGITNLIKWFPIIWRDRNYDYSYIYAMLEFKLRNQAKFIADRNNHTRAKRDSEIMILCANLIKKIDNGDYKLEYGDYHETKFEFIPIEDGKYFQLDTTELEENFQDYFDKYPLIYKKVTKTDKFIFDNDSKLHIAMNIAYENERRAKALLFKTLENNIDRFWD